MRMTAKEIAEILGVSRISVLKKARKENWPFIEEPSSRGKPVKYYLIEALPHDVRSYIYNVTDNEASYINNVTTKIGIETAKNENDKNPNVTTNGTNGTTNGTNGTTKIGIETAKTESGSFKRNSYRNQKTEKMALKEPEIDALKELVWLSVSEASKYLNIKERSVRKNCKRGKYRTVETAYKGKTGKKFLIALSSLPSEAIIRWIEENKEKAKGFDREYIAKLPPDAAWEVAKLKGFEVSVFDKVRNVKVSEKILRKLKVVKEVMDRPSGVSLACWVRDVARRNGLSERTVYRYMRKYAYEGIEGFMINRSKGLTRWSEEALSFLKGVYLKSISTAGDISKLKAYEITVEQAKKNGWSVGSYSSAVKYLSGLNHLLVKYAKGGRMALDNFFYIVRDWSDLEPFEIIIGDQHRFDLWVRDDETGEAFRPEGFIWIDARTRLIYGISIAKHYDKNLVAHAMRMGLMKYGLFKKCYTDNGKPELSRYVDEIIRDIGGFDVEHNDIAELYRDKNSGMYVIEDREGNPVEVVDNAKQWHRHIKAIVRNAKAKPIERFFRSFEAILRDELLAGAVRDLRATADESRQSDLRLKEQMEKERLLTFSEFVLEVFKAADKYNNRVHSSLRRSPVACLNKLIKEGYKPVRISKADIDFILLARTARSVRRGRVLLNGELYEGEGLSKDNPNAGLWHIPDGTRIEVRYDPFDSEVVYAVLGDGDVRVLHKVVKGSMKDDEKTRRLLEKKREMIRVITEAYREFVKPIPAVVKHSKIAFLAKRHKSKKQNDVDIEQIKKQAKEIALESLNDEKLIRIPQKGHFKNKHEYYEYCVAMMETGGELTQRDLEFMAAYESNMSAEDKEYWDVYRRLIRKEVL